MLDSRGTILIITIWILSILTLFAIGMGFRMSIESKLAGYNVAEFKNLHAVRAAANAVGAVLIKDDTEAYDALSDNWASNEELFKEAQLGDCLITVSYAYTAGNTEIIMYGPMDEASKININMLADSAMNGEAKVKDAARAILNTLFTKQEAVEGEGGEGAGGAGADPIGLADIIIDWWDDNDTKGDDGAEKDYYEMLEPPYKCKNAPFDSIEELLLLKDITRGVFDKAKDMITVYGNDEKKVNLNTASEEVLEALGLHEEVVRSIIDRRMNEEGEGFSEEGAIKDVTKVIEGLNLGEDAQKNIDILTNFTGVKSNTFRAFVKAASKDGRIIKNAEAVMIREGKKIKTGSWYEY